MRVIPAYTGEFGLRIYYHVPQVHTICQRESCVVEIEPGMEALYPAAAEWRIVDGPSDHSERGGRGRPPDLGVEPTRFVPEPHERLSDYAWYRVVICPRRMLYGQSKNWDGWRDLATDLWQSDIPTFYAGAEGSSDPMEGCGGDELKAWRYERPLDITIETMRRARLVIATDAGLAHLAVLCGAPLLVVTYRGLVAPGPVIDSSGRKARDSYWRAGYDPAERVNRFEDANHTGSPIEYVDGWEDPGAVVDHARRMMS